jgi:hypothetical protein
VLVGFHRVRDVQSQVADLRAQGSPGDPQKEGGPGLVAAGVLQDAGEQVPVQLPVGLGVQVAGVGAELEDPPSDGADILAVGLADHIAGMIVLGLLTEGANNRNGKLIRRLEDRNSLQIKIDPDWTSAGRDVVRGQLGIPDGRDAYVSFCTIARRDPDGGRTCPDCKKYRKDGKAWSPRVAK